MQNNEVSTHEWGIMELLLLSQAVVDRSKSVKIMNSDNNNDKKEIEISTTSVLSSPIN